MLHVLFAKDISSNIGRVRIKKACLSMSEVDLKKQRILIRYSEAFLILIQPIFKEMFSAKSHEAEFEGKKFTIVRKCDDKTSQNLNMKKFATLFLSLSLTVPHIFTPQPVSSKSATVPKVIRVMPARGVKKC